MDHQSHPGMNLGLPSYGLKVLVVICETIVTEANLRKIQFFYHIHYLFFADVVLDDIDVNRLDVRSTCNTGKSGNVRFISITNC